MLDEAKTEGCQTHGFMHGVPASGSNNCSGMERRAVQSELQIEDTGVQAKEDDTK